MDIYGHFFIGFHKIHYVTFVGMVALGITYLYHFRNLNAPILIKILLPCVYIFGALMHYEIMWNFVWMFYRSGAGVDFVGFILCEALVIYTIDLMRNKYKYNAPRIGLNRWIMITAILGVMMVWLYTTGFYADYKLLYTGASTIDPHNFAWAVGKLFALLSWIFITNKKKAGGAYTNSKSVRDAYAPSAALEADAMPTSSAINTRNPSQSSSAL